MYRTVLYPNNPQEKKNFECVVVDGKIPITCVFSFSYNFYYPQKFHVICIALHHQSTANTFKTLKSLPRNPDFK